MIRYLCFLEVVQTLQDKSKLKYLDEAHFVSRFLNNGKVWGLKPRRVYTRDNALRDPSASITIITSLDEVCLFVSLFLHLIV